MNLDDGPLRIVRVEGVLRAGPDAVLDTGGQVL